MTSDLIAELTSIATRLDDIEDRIGLLCTEGRWPEAVELYATFNAVRSAMGQRDGSLAAVVAEAMPSDRETVPGVGFVQRRRGRDRKNYDAEELLRLLVRNDLDPEGTGELPVSPMVAIESVVNTVLACAPITPSMQWRVSALRARGVDPDEWCESTPGRVSLQITAAE